MISATTDTRCVIDIRAFVSCFCQATDDDAGINRQIEFKVEKVRFQDNNNQIDGKRMLFEAVTTQQNDVYVGIIQ